MPSSRAFTARVTSICCALLGWGFVSDADADADDAVLAELKLLLPLLDAA
eukprot:CAMPEP_0178708120 /NCGR_PEP_ID=MMETSP0699-20121125/16452_1 /TAXON_ID=265572 /ORGANISM="Extubocellulus spinifer, Strain CCMP396" /LENGTH=49 /DNA_ID= /DNA_START= /DNA_END= /DNA_ORIENTATION=